MFEIDLLVYQRGDKIRSAAQYTKRPRHQLPCAGVVVSSISTSRGDPMAKMEENGGGSGEQGCARRTVATARGQGTAGSEGLSFLWSGMTSKQRSSPPPNIFTLAHSLQSPESPDNIGCEGSGCFKAFRFENTQELWDCVQQRWLMKHMSTLHTVERPTEKWVLLLLEKKASRSPVGEMATQNPVFLRFRGGRQVPGLHRNGLRNI